MYSSGSKSSKRSSSVKSGKNKSGGEVKKGGSIKSKPTGGNINNGSGIILPPSPKKSALKVSYKVVSAHLLLSQ